MNGTLFIFVKAPVAGNVKTRLAKDIGPARAAALFRLLTMQTIAEARKGGWRTVVAIDPPTALGRFSNCWPPPLPRWVQPKGDLGKRMSAAFRAAPKGPIIIIGADAPAVRVRHIRAAFNALRGHDAVFGPATDGGYWLIGLARRRGVPDLFAEVRWSTPFALADTLSSLPKSFSVATVETLRDLDDGRDMKACGSRALLRSIARV